jgi:hypothetical protein
VFKLFAAEDSIASTFKKLDLTLDSGIPASYAKIHP